MAKIHTYNKFGVDFPTSYWRLTSISINMGERTATFGFTGYASQEARTNNSQPIDFKETSIQGITFDKYMNLHLKRGFSIMRCAYMAAKENKTFPEASQDA